MPASIQLSKSIRFSPGGPASGVETPPFRLFAFGSLWPDFTTVFLYLLLKKHGVEFDPRFVFG